MPENSNKWVWFCLIKNKTILTCKFHRLNLLKAAEVPEKITYNAKYGLSTSFTRVLQPCDFLELVVHPVVYQARLLQLIQLLTEPEQQMVAGLKLLSGLRVRCFHLEV